MFKNIMKHKKKEEESLAVAQERAECSSNGTHRTSGGESITSTATKSSNISAMKRGKKKLSSMMNKLQKSGGRFGFRSNKTKSGLNTNGSLSGDSQLDNNSLCSLPHNGLPYEFDSDEDDDAYKSAEEGCHEEEEEVEEEEKAQKRDEDQSQMHSSKQKQKQKQKTSKSSQQQEQSKKYSVDSGKFILPEEQCDIPTFLHTKNCDRELIDETRRLLKERYAKNPDSFYENDYQRMLNDDWTVTRFLLRRRLDPKRTAKLMEECGRFRIQYKMSEMELWEFPIEFHKAGGLFMYAPDRVGNVTMYMRVKMYRRVPEISDVFKAFILCVLEQCDVINNGRGTAVIFDLSGCGLQNVDLGFLSWLLSSFRNYCPKGVSYILVYNLPWILNATCKMAMTWMSASNRRALRFVYGDEIENFISRDNMPDYCGGTCELNYRKVPSGSLPAVEVCERLDITRPQAIKIRELFKEYLDDDYDKISEKTATTTTLVAQKQADAKSHYDDAKSTILDNTSEQQQQHQHQQQDFSNTIVANGLANGQQQNGPANTMPVVDLVSQASRFIAQ